MTLQANNAPVSTVTSEGPKANPQITSFSITAVESTLVIPAGVKSYKIQTAMSTNAVVYYATSVGGTASSSSRYDVPIGGCIEDSDLSGESAITLYVKTMSGSATLQAWFWS